MVQLSFNIRKKNGRKFVIDMMKFEICKGTKSGCVMNAKLGAICAKTEFNLILVITMEAQYQVSSLAVEHVFQKYIRHSNVLMHGTSHSVSLVTAHFTSRTFWKYASRIFNRKLTRNKIFSYAVLGSHQKQMMIGCNDMCLAIQSHDLLL